MSLLTDIKNVSDTVIEQLSGQFHDLPRPLLAAIGAGDLAVERLAKLREQLTDGITAGGTPSGEDVKAFAADLPARAQKVAGDVAHHLEEFASTAPEKVQHLIGELPAKAAELTDSLSPDHIRGTVEGYTQMVAMIYDNLAERGGKATERVRGQARQGDDRGGATQAAATTTAPKRASRKPATRSASTTRKASGAASSTRKTSRTSSGRSTGKGAGTTQA